MDSQNEGKPVSNTPNGKNAWQTPRGGVGGTHAARTGDPLRFQEPFSAVRFLIITIGGIFLGEVIAMIVIQVFDSLPYYQQILLDASIMSILVFPVVYYFSLRPLIRLIEKQQRIETALWQSEERFARAFHSSPAALSITRVADLVFLDVNESFLRLYGHKREDVIGHTPAELGMFTGRDPQAETQGQLLGQGRNVHDVEVTTCIRGGEIRSILVSSEDIEINGEACVLGSISDITERKRAEQAVAAERQRFNDVLETLPVYLVLLTTDYHVPFANRFFRERFGESEGHRCYEYLFQRSAPCENCETFRALSSMSPERWEWIGPDGRIYDVYDYPFTDTDGSTLILEMGIDITERKKAEQALQHSLELQERFFNSVDTLIAYMDRDFNFIRVNNMYAVADGRPPAFFVGRNHFDLYPNAENRGIFEQVVATGEAFSAREKPFEYPEHPEWGMTYWDWSLQPVKGVDGKVEGVALSLKDVTEQKRAEAENVMLSRIVEQTRDTVVVTNRKGVIEYVNPAFEALTGFTREDSLGRTPRLLKSGLHDGEFYRTLWGTILKGEVFQSEIANCKKNGELLYEVKTITPLRDAQGKITHFVATGKDVTEHKRDEEKLQKAYEDLEVRVQERTEELRIAISELEGEIHERRQAEEKLKRFNSAMVGRELRMIELKKEVNKFCESVGQPPRYSLEFEEEGTLPVTRSGGGAE